MMAMPVSRIAHFFLFVVESSYVIVVWLFVLGVYLSFRVFQFFIIDSALSSPFSFANSNHLYATSEFC